MTIVQTMRSNTYINIPAQLIPFVCVFIITKMPLILLVGLAVGYIMILPNKSTNKIVLDKNHSNNMTIIDPLLMQEDEEEKERHITVNKSVDDDDEDEDEEEDDGMTISSDNDNNEEEEGKKSEILQSAVAQNLQKKSSALFLDDDNMMSNTSIDFENFMKFPSCPTTLPRLDTHFNFVIDHDIKSPDPSNIDWSAINQELEYDQQRLDVADHHSNICENTKYITTDQQQHPLLLLHQLQQDNLSIMFSDEEEENSLFPSPYSVDGNKNDSSNTIITTETAAIIMQKEEEKDINYNSVSTPTPFYNITTNAAILFVDNEEFAENRKKGVEEDETLFNVNIEDLLLLPPPQIPSKPSLSSPGQLFKSNFQKAVKKMKKSSSNIAKHEETSDKWSITYSNGSSKIAASLQLHTYFPHHQQQQQEDPLFATALSPRPSASARVRDHLKGRLNKLFRK